MRGINRKNDIVTSVSNELNIEKKAVEEVYDLYFKFIREKIDSYDFSRSYTDEEFKKTLRSFSLKHIGKFYVSKVYLNNIDKYVNSKRVKAAIYKHSNNNE